MKAMDAPARFTTAMRATMHCVTSLAISRRLRVDLLGASAPELMATATSLGDELMNDLLAPRLL